MHLDVKERLKYSVLRDVLNCDKVGDRRTDKGRLLHIRGAFTENERPPKDSSSNFGVDRILVSAEREPSHVVEGASTDIKYSGARPFKHWW